MYFGGKQCVAESKEVKSEGRHTDEDDSLNSRLHSPSGELSRALRALSCPRELIYTASSELIPLFCYICFRDQEAGLREAFSIVHLAHTCQKTVIPQFSKYLWNIFYMPGTLLPMRDIKMIYTALILKQFPILKET